MNGLSLFFPPNSHRRRTVVHAGPLLAECPGGLLALSLFLKRARRRDLVLVHPCDRALAALAEEAGVTDLVLDADGARDPSLEAGEMALALGAEGLDFTIDEPAIFAPSGRRLRRLSVSAAEALARDPARRARVRAKLRAGGEAVRCGLARVRIGTPESLASGRATEIVPGRLARIRNALRPPPRWASAHMPSTPAEA